MRAATSPFEVVRRQAMRRSPLASFDELAALLTYSVGDHVWVRFGNTRGIQLARVRMAQPIAFEGTGAEWWWVEVWWPTRGRWTSAHRRVVRSLTPAELRAVRQLGVVTEASS